MTTTRQTGAAIVVHGLPQLRAALRTLDAETQRGLRAEGKAIATEVSEDARGLASSLGSVAAKSAPAVGPTSAGRDLLRSGVVLNASSHPYAAGAEFGAVQYPQFQPWRGSGPGAGYFLYPTIRKHAPGLEDRLMEPIEAAIRSANLR